MNNIFKRILILLIAVTFLTINKSNAQDNILYNMRHLPQFTNNNPAFQPNACVFVGFPGLNNISLELHSTGFTFNEAFKPHPYELDSFLINTEKLEEVLENENFINYEHTISLINFGFALQNDFYFTFSINNRMSESFKYPNLLEVTHGNYRADGTPLSFNFGQNFTAYNEIAVGLSKKFFNNVTVGGRLKYLSGLMNTRTDKFQIDWYTETSQDSMYEWTFDTDFDIKTASPVPFSPLPDKIDEKNAGDIFSPDSVALEQFQNNINPVSLLFTKNWGLAVDLGVEYELNKTFNFSLSILDLGFINWKTNPRTLTQSGKFKFSGVDLGKYVQNINDIMASDSVQEVFIQDFTDSLANFIAPTASEEAYKTYLQAKLFAGASYNPTKWFNLGLLYRGQLQNGHLYSALTVSANLNFLRAWSFSAGYTAFMDRNYNNIGIGFSYRVGLFQWYLMTDNIIPYAYVATESETTDRWIRNTKSFNIHMGFNILFYCKPDKSLLD